MRSLSMPHVRGRVTMSPAGPRKAATRTKVAPDPAPVGPSAATSDETTRRASHPAARPQRRRAGEAGRLPVLFLNVNQARTGFVDGQEIAKPYRWASRLLRSGLIDRTSTLNTGFVYEYLDPIPTMVERPLAFNAIADAVASDIVAEAVEKGQRIQMMWSGGIDSTTALTALLRILDDGDELGRLDVLLSDHSVAEYPSFYTRFIRSRVVTVPVTSPVGDYLRPDHLIVTGEHGDQLFGSFLAKELVTVEVAHQDYENVLPRFFEERLSRAGAGEAALAYLVPQFGSSPVQIESAFDALWWINFSLKWQSVALRIAAFSGEDAGTQYASTRHFFRDPRFQQWSLAQTGKRTPQRWSDYKEPAKAYIRSFTDDDDYYAKKTKEGSLKNVLGGPKPGQERVAIYMLSDMRPRVETFHPDAATHSVEQTIHG
jgi:hypothetical protein